VNKLEIASYLLSLRDHEVFKKDLNLAAKAFNQELFDSVYREGPEHYGAGLKGFEDWVVMLAIASCCKPGETTCEIEDADLVERVSLIKNCFIVLGARKRHDSIRVSKY
jgi:hypothetical protein